MTQPFFIEPDGYYDTDAVATICEISVRSIGDACRTQQLRFSERAGKRFFRGSWIIEWLEGQGHQLEPVASNHETLPV